MAMSMHSAGAALRGSALDVGRVGALAMALGVGPVGRGGAGGTGGTGGQVVTAAARPFSPAMAAPAAARTERAEVTGRQRRHHSESANGGYYSLSDDTAPLS